MEDRLKHQERDVQLEIEKEKMVKLASSQSMKISLESIISGDAGLNAHRQSILNRVPETGDFASFRLNSLEMKDLAYLTAKTGHEFALLRGKKNDYLFHGSRYHCSFEGELYDMLIEHRLTLVGHSHPGEEIPEPSDDDRKVLQLIGQKNSQVISARTGRIAYFTSDPFDL